MVGKIEIAGERLRKFSEIYSYKGIGVGRGQ